MECFLCPSEILRIVRGLRAKNRPPPPGPTFFSSPDRSGKRSGKCAGFRAILSRAATPLLPSPPSPPRCSRRCRSILRTATLCVVYHTECISTVSFTRFPRGDPFQSCGPFRPRPPLLSRSFRPRDDACLIVFAFIRATPA